MGLGQPVQTSTGAFLCAGFEHYKEATAMQNQRRGSGDGHWGVACRNKHNGNS